MKSTIRICLALTFLLLQACVVGDRNSIRGSGSLASEERTVNGITKVSLTTFGELTIQTGEAESLVIEAEDNLLPYIETTVQGGTLTIRSAPNTQLQPTRNTKYTLTVKSLDGLEASSSGNITAPSLQAGKFDIKINSSGNITLAGLTAEQLTVDINSSGNVEIGAGEVGEQTITINSSGAYRAGELHSQSADVNNRSSGEATLWVTDKLKVDLSSSGNVNYFGEPEVTQKTTSSGKVVALGPK